MLALFYLFFKWLLSRSTFFLFNRVFLLFGISACLIFPCIKVNLPGNILLASPFHAVEQYFIEPELVEHSTKLLQAAASGQITESTNQQEGIPIEKAVIDTRTRILAGLLYLYLIGAFIVSAKFLCSYFRMFSLILHSPRKKCNNYTLVIVDNKECSFSWGKYLVVAKKDYELYPEIMMHEQAHIRSFHTLDLLYMQLLLILQWFNPVIWLLNRELLEIHEYQADNKTINSGIDATRYQLLLVKKAVGTRLYSMANGFNHSKLKKRISMMVKEKTNKFVKLRALLFVPVMIGGLYAFAYEHSEAVSEIPEGHEIVQTSPSPEEYLKNDLKSYERMVYGTPLEPDKRKYATNFLYINFQNRIMYNSKLYDLEGVKRKTEKKGTLEVFKAEIVKTAEEVRKESIAKTSKPAAHIIEFRKDIKTDDTFYKQIFEVVAEASQILKGKYAGSDNNPATLFPIVLYVVNDFGTKPN